MLILLTRPLGRVFFKKKKIYEKKGAIILAMLMAGSTLSACGSLKVNVGGKDIVNIEEKTESIADDMNSENKDLQKVGNQNDENETDFDTNEWDNEKKTTFSGSGIDLTLPEDTPDTFVEVNKLEKDYFTLTVFCDYKNTSVGSESSLTKSAENSPTS